MVAAITEEERQSPWVEIGSISERIGDALTQFLQGNRVQPDPRGIVHLLSFDRLDAFELVRVRDLALDCAVCPHSDKACRETFAGIAVLAHSKIKQITSSASETNRTDATLPTLPPDFNRN